MELILKILCPICGGSLVYSSWIKEEKPLGLVWTQFDCPCAETEYPGYRVLGATDISDLADIITDIQNKVDDIKEKFDEHIGE